MNDIASEFEGNGGAPQGASLDALKKVLDEATSLEVAVEQMEADLQAAKARLNSLKTVRIPDMMTELQIPDITFQEWKVKINDFVSGSIPSDPDRRAAALAWLEQHDGAGIIKTGLSLEFAKSQHNEALDLAARLQEEGYNATIASSVHPQTLKAFANERLRNGEPINTEVLGLYVGKVAKFSKIKEKPKK